jgi:Uma2 family endonuclease
MTTATSLMTAEAFAQLPDDGRLLELVNGELIEMPSPRPGHGYVCGEIYFAIRSFLATHPSGQAFTNDTGVITTRGPDSVRGPDVCYFSYARLPKAALSFTAYADSVPEVVFEVRSPTERWARVLSKVAEYLDAGVLAVCLVDPAVGSVAVYRPNEFQQVLSNSDVLRLPELHPDFAVPVSRFFPG